MSMRWMVSCALAGALLAACAATPDEAPSFDPAACYQRDFSIYFDEHRAELTRDARRIIDLQGAAIRGCRIDEVRIIGLSGDEEGGSETARQISVRRAEVLADYLAQRVGWPRARFRLLATGSRGAVTEEGLQVPVRHRARIVVDAAAP
jgi:outer membrane protein OmpA-like peptidoglycan-associated protein